MDSIEQMIQDKGLTAPRITPADIEAVIIAEHYFTAADGVLGHSMNSGAGRYRDPAVEQAHSLLTFCVLVLRNGFTVTGTSACASPENFDAEVGKAAARRQAINDIWKLEGYLLKQRLHDNRP